MAGRKDRRPDEDFIKIFRDSSEPVLTAREVAEILDYTKDGAYKRLEKLDEDGVLNSKRVGASAKVYWLSEE